MMEQNNHFTAMSDHPSPPLDRPIRAVVFGGGPGLERGVRLFLARLEDHSDIHFLGAFCQSPGQQFFEILNDLWRRRGFLAVPLLFAFLLHALTEMIFHPKETVSLKRKMERLAPKIKTVEDIHAPAVIEQISLLKPDLGLIYGSPILRPELFEIPVFGTLGIHHGKVPEYRGKKTTFWAMYNGESVAGVTIQKVNAGLDTGQIVKRGEVSIGRRMRSSVWRELENLGVELYIQAILEVKKGIANYQPQQGSKGNLYYDPTLRELIVFWFRQFRRAIKG